MGKLIRRNYVANFSKASFIGYFSILCDAVGRGNFVSDPENRFINPITDEEIIKLLKINESTFNRFIAECRRNNYVARYTAGSRKSIIVNPAYRMYYPNVCKDMMVYQAFSNDITFLSFLNNLEKKYYLKNNIDIDSKIEELAKDGQTVNDFNKYINSK